MADVMVSQYRFAEVDEDNDRVIHHRLQPGDSVKDLPKEVREDLKERGLIRDEKWLDKRTNVLLPPEEVLKNEQVRIPSDTPLRSQSQLTDKRSEEEREKQAGPKDAPEAKSESKDDDKGKKGS